LRAIKPRDRLVKISCGFILTALLLGACQGKGAFKKLTSEEPVVEIAEGLTLSVNPATLTPDFAVQLTALAPESFTGAQSNSAWGKVLQALPSNLQLQSPLYEIKTTGKPPEQISLGVMIPSAANSALLDLYAWDGKAWNFLPVELRQGQMVAEVSKAPAALGLFEAAPLPPLALTTLEPGQALTAAAVNGVNGVLLGGIIVQADGSLAGQLPEVPLDQNLALYPLVRNYDQTGVNQAVLSSLLYDPALRTNHLQGLVSFIVSGNYQGLAIDYRGLSHDLEQSYTDFIAKLAQRLQAQNKILLLQIETPKPDAYGAFAAPGYDLSALGASADVLLLSVADDPTAFGNGSAETLLTWAVSDVNRRRLRLTTSALSVDSVNGSFTLRDQTSALAPLGSVVAPSGAALVGQVITMTLSGKAQTLEYDSQAFAARYTYADEAGATHAVWITSSHTLRQRLALAEKYHLGGVMVSELLNAGVPSDLANAITQYKVSLAAPAQMQAGLVWTVKDASGVLAQATAQPNQPYVYAVSGPGDYQFSAELQTGNLLSLGSVAVSVANITPTPGSTAAPTGGGGSTGGGSTGGATPGGGTTGGGGGGFVPPPPVSGGPFELGGQVPGFIGHPTEMHQAGMSWVKFQACCADIAGGKAAGFKVLISAIGDRTRAADPSYWPEYASWVAGIAAQGADAIEVWNEMNIEAEWPEGQISGATYTQLLQQAYTAIKGANSSTLVVSGALAPTGAEAAFPGKVMNDDHFLAEMAAAGAANYMDCVGIHFNGGTTSPNDTSGSALSGYHYSYYFWPMVDLYYNAFGGSRPLCFTELGYLTPEGYGSLSPNFSWAADTTVAEQAQWLAESASLSGSSGKVRLMIVWNVDFTVYGNDPQAGFAMLRPGGSCPACAALGAVMQ